MDKTIEDIEITTYRKNRRLVHEKSIDPVGLEPIIGYAQEPLLPLTDACKSLVGIVENILHYVSIALQTTADTPAQGLTHDESASIRLYTMEWSKDRKSLYYILNITLRMGDRAQLRPWFKYLKLFLTALVKIPCAPSQTVWRGVRQNVRDAFPPGTEATWWSFSSCTTTLTVLENELYLGRSGERTLFSVEVFNGRDISQHSYFKTEDEILLLPGTHMEVRSQFNPTTDMYIIHLRQTIPTTVLLEPPFENAPLYPTTKSSGRRWYYKKKFLIPVSIVLILCIVAVVLGLTLTRKTSSTTTETQSKVLIPGICRNARWKESGFTVAGGKYVGDGFDQLNSPDGIFVKEDGTVYIADGNNQRIIRWNPDTSYGYLLAGGNGAGNSANQFGFPVDVFIDQNETMYITDFRNRRVQQWLSGAFDAQTVLANHTFIGIWLDDEGSLYTSDWTDNAVTKWRKGNPVGQILAFGFDRLERLYVDQNQSIYVVDRGNHSVIKIVQDTENISIVAGGRLGQSLGALNSPRGVTVDELGNVYVADTLNHRIVRWSPGATSGILVVGGRGDGSKADQLQRPTDLQFDGYGNLYVADSGNHRIQKFVIDKSLC